MVLAETSGLDELLDRHSGRRNIGVPKAQINDIDTRVPQLNLQTVDDREDVRGKVVDASKLHGVRLVLGPLPMHRRSSPGPFRLPAAKTPPIESPVPASGRS